jgi:hypothetical protein
MGLKVHVTFLVKHAIRLDGCTEDRYLTGINGGAAVTTMNAL